MALFIQAQGVQAEDGNPTYPMGRREPDTRKCLLLMT